MANDLAYLAVWTFGAECLIPQDFSDILIEGEVAEYAFKTIRDIALFTNKRLSVRDAQGLTGKKVEMYSLPYKSINMYSSENAGKIDFNAEIELWTRAGQIKINLNRDADIRRIDKLIAQHIL